MIAVKHLLINIDIDPTRGEFTVASIKRYNLAGVSANVELGKQGSYISGNANAIGFYTNTDTLQNIAIANATASDHAVTKAQLDEVTQDLIQHLTLDFSYNTGSTTIANISAGSRVIGVTVDVPTAWTGTANNQATYIEVGDTNNSSRFIRGIDVDVLTVGQYHSQYQYEYSSDDTLTVNVVQGSASAGTATVSILLSTGLITITDYGSISNTGSNVDLGNIA